MVGHSERMPGGLSVLSPSFARASSAYQRLENTRSLLPQHRGFQEVAALYLKHLEQFNPNDDLSQVEVMKVTREDPVLRIGRDGAGGVTPLSIAMSNGQTLSWDMGQLGSAMGSLRSRNLFLAACIAFACGLALQIASYVLKARERN
jgi:hypothetical protein